MCKSFYYLLSTMSPPQISCKKFKPTYIFYEYLIALHCLKQKALNFILPSVSIEILLFDGLCFAEASFSIVATLGFTYPTINSRSSSDCFDVLCQKSCFLGLENGSGEGSGSGEAEDNNETSYNGYDDNGKIKDAIGDYGDDALQIQGGSLNSEGSAEDEWSLSDHFANLDSINKARKKMNDELKNFALEEGFDIKCFQKLF